MYDQQMREAFKDNNNSVVGYLLMASWIYYHKPHMAPILSDEVFDKSCKWLLDNFDNIDHRYKSRIAKRDLVAGSLYSLGSYDYPPFIIHFAELLSQGLDAFLAGGEV